MENLCPPHPFLSGQINAEMQEIVKSSHTFQRHCSTYDNDGLNHR